MTKIEQIKAEIVHMQSRLNLDNPWGIGAHVNLGTLLSFIESLEKEQPQGLDEAAEEYAYNEYPSQGVANVECEKHFRAGAEWRDSQFPRLSNNLDEAELKYVESSNIPPANQEEEMMVYDAFKAGAKWRDEQITKLPDNIHKAAVQFAQRAYSPFDDPYEMSRAFENDVACFEAGVKWVLEQLKMEE